MLAEEVRRCAPPGMEGRPLATARDSFYLPLVSEPEPRAGLWEGGGILMGRRGLASDVQGGGASLPSGRDPPPPPPLPCPQSASSVSAAEAWPHTGPGWRAAFRKSSLPEEGPADEADGAEPSSPASPLLLVPRRASAGGVADPALRGPNKDSLVVRDLSAVSPCQAPPPPLQCV